MANDAQFARRLAIRSNKIFLAICFVSSNSPKIFPCTVAKSFWTLSRYQAEYILRLKFHDFHWLPYSPHKFSVQPKKGSETGKEESYEGKDLKPFNAN